MVNTKKQTRISHTCNNWYLFDKKCDPNVRLAICWEHMLFVFIEWWLIRSINITVGVTVESWLTKIEYTMWNNIHWLWDTIAMTQNQTFCSFHTITEFNVCSVYLKFTVLLIKCWDDHLEEWWIRNELYSMLFFDLVIIFESNALKVSIFIASLNRRHGQSNLSHMSSQHMFCMYMTSDHYVLLSSKQTSQFSPRQTSGQTKNGTKMGLHI